MCTVSWHFSKNGYQLFFNRDELLTRQQAIPPALKVSKGVTSLSPTDPDAGGTWISLNQYGLTLCLLNNYGAQTRLKTDNWISRGQLVSDLAPLPDLASIQEHIEGTRLEQYRPFDLLALSLDCHTRLLSWDGLSLRIHNAPVMPLTSSSFNTQEVIKSRIGQFAQCSKNGSPQPDQLLDYHASHSPQSGPYSVCMHRDNGQTVSFSHIHVTHDSASFRYYEGPPCSSGKVHTTQIGIQPYLQPDVA
ncbi:MAG: NRDE family protein [Pseudomonadales bacterium]